MVEALNTLGIKELQHIDASHQGFFERCTNGNNLLADGNGRILNVSDFIKPNDKGPNRRQLTISEWSRFVLKAEHRSIRRQTE